MPMRAEILMNMDGEGKIMGLIPGWLSTSMWVPVESDYFRRDLSLPLY